MLKLLAWGGRSARLAATAAAALLPDGSGMNHVRQKKAPLTYSTKHSEKRHFNSMYRVKGYDLGN